jgi:hypothetical protein
MNFKTKIMKKLLLFTLAIGMVACSQEDSSNNTDQQDCNCDRVVQVNTFNVIGTPQNPAINYYSVYTTINDCTQIQREKNFNTTNPSLSPQLGQCR